jgi:hypothetical protein
MPRSFTAADSPAPGQPFRFTGAGAVSFGAEEAGSDGKPKLGTFDGIGYTGAVMTPGGWYGRIVCDLAGIKFPADKHRPIYHQHDSQQLVGHSSDLAIGPEGLKVSGVFSGQAEHVRKVTEPAGKGFKWQMSIGATPVRTSWLEAGETAEVNGQTVTGPLTISHETELGEVSFVPLGADGSTSVAVSASKGGSLMFAKLQLKLARRQGYKAAAKFSDEDIEKMTEEEAKAALAKCQEEPEPKAKAEDDDEAKKKEEEEKKKAEAARQAAGFTANNNPQTDVGKQFLAELQKELRDGAAAELNRQSQIKARCQGFGNQLVKLDDGRTVDLIPHAIAANWTADQAELAGLRANRPGPGVGVPGGLVYSTSTPEASEAVLEAAVLHAARHSFKLADNDFYSQPTPDGRGTMRRVPEYLQRQSQGEMKARYTDQVEQSAHTLFKGRIGLHQIFRIAAASWGGGYARQIDFTGEHGVRDFLAAWDHNSHSRPGFHAEGASNVSLGNVLANVMNKFALQGYLFTEQAWREIVGIRPVNDFKPTKSINLLGDVMYKAIGPTGELNNASLTDQAFSNQAAPFGRILTLPWTHIVNDDLGMLSGAPQKIGQGAGLALNDLIWTLKAAMYAGSVNGDDGNAFYRTTEALTAAVRKAGTAYRANKLTAGAASALSAAALQVAKKLFDNQVDPNGNPLGFDGLTPRLLFGPANWQTATALLQAVAIVYGGASSALQPNVNVWAGAGLKPVMSRYMESPNHVNSETAWEVCYDPAAMPSVEVAFLNGKDTPDVLTAGPDYQFDRLGISVRGTMSMGATQQNFRGSVYSPGA